MAPWKARSSVLSLPKSTAYRYPCTGLMQRLFLYCSTSCQEWLHRASTGGKRPTLKWYVTQLHPSTSTGSPLGPWPAATLASLPCGLHPSTEPNNVTLCGGPNQLATRTHALLGMPHLAYVHSSSAFCLLSDSIMLQLCTLQLVHYLSTSSHVGPKRS